ncbi:MAG: TIR domain-containing protein [Bryobacteraceae bacterium]|nr:TIR domain-containing protein [Bryobacteraceae bacterium]
MRAIDRRQFELLLGMESGYVLDFSDNTFADFFKDYGSIEIHSEKYSTSGTSKANKLREFWRLESDALVSAVMHGLLEHWSVCNPTPSKEEQRLAERCAVTASALASFGVRLVTQDDLPRIWSASGYRVFLSHKAEAREETALLKAQLCHLGIAAFVAHEDIEPTRPWQDEIENALASMEAFVALMTDDFHNSNWTDQEVGYAYAIGVPLIAVRLGKDPYGFIGRFQALRVDWKSAPIEIARLLVKEPRMLDGFVHAAEVCSHFDHGNQLAQLLPSISAMSDAQAGRLVQAFNANYELRGSFGFNGSKSRQHGPGLPAHLNRITGRQYAFTGPRGDLRIVGPRLRSQPVSKKMNQ